MQRAVDHVTKEAKHQVCRFAYVFVANGEHEGVAGLEDPNGFLVRLVQ